MRILVHEYVSGGGLAGRPVPQSLAREGLAMRTALVADLAALGTHDIVTTADRRFPVAPTPRVSVVTLSPRERPSRLNALIEGCDAVWLIAPETGRRLERLAARVERRGKLLIGSGARAVRTASDKTRLPALLDGRRLAHPVTHLLPRGRLPRSLGRELTFPVGVKPGRGAGCGGVSVAWNRGELRRALPAARAESGATPLVLQSFVRGTAASVSLLADGRGGVLPLTVNAQSVRGSHRVLYHGGHTPLEHPLAGSAREAAAGACRAIPGLRGYVGVDLVLTDRDAVVIEVNARVTTAYLGVRAAIDANLAGLALTACTTGLPAPPAIRRAVRFTAAGRVAQVGPVRSSICP